MAYRTLEMTLISAKDLRDVNLLSKMEVYAIASIAGDPRSKQRTTTDRDGGKNPTWNHTFKFTVPNQDPGRIVIHVLLRCERALGDRDVGEVHVPLRELLDASKASAGDEMKPATAPQYVSYQVRTLSSGKSKGVLNISYKFSDLVTVSAPTAANKLVNPVGAYPTPAPYYAADPYNAYPPPPVHNFDAYPPPTTAYPPPAPHKSDDPATAYPPPTTAYPPPANHKSDDPVTAYPPTTTPYPPPANHKSDDPATAYPPPASSKSNEPVIAYPAASSSAAYPPLGGPQGGYAYGPPPPQSYGGYGGYPPASQAGYGGYPPPPPQGGYGAPQGGYGYGGPPQGGYGYGAPPQVVQPAKKNKFGMGLGAGLLGGALGGMLIGDMVSDAGSYDAGYDDGFGGGMDF